jgi:hypothetical protein
LRDSPSRISGTDRLGRCCQSPIRTSLRNRLSLFPGKCVFGGRDNGAEKVRQIQPLVSRDKGAPRNPANLGLFVGDGEISVRSGLCGGAGRTRTSNQVVIAKRWTKQGVGGSSCFSFQALRIFLSRSNSLISNAAIFIYFPANVLKCCIKLVTLNQRVQGSSPCAPTKFL